MTALYPHSCTRRISWRAPNNPETIPAPFGEREDVALQYIPTMESSDKSAPAILHHVDDS